MKTIIKKYKFRNHVIFDAVRDNKRKGLKASDLLKILKKIDRYER